MGFLLNGVNTGGIPMYIIEKLISNYDIPYFVETGTAAGDSVKTVAPFFKKCFTVECIEGRQEVENAPINIMFLQGNSPEVLSDIVGELLQLKSDSEHQFVFFWLDAHYSGNTPNETDFPECPLLDEIEQIARYGEDAIIFIDDARLFFGHPPHPNDPRQWPSIKDIFATLNKHFPYHHTTITDDYIISVPIHVREIIDEEWRDRFHVRYPSAEDKLKTEVKNVYAAFKKYIEC